MPAQQLLTAANTLNLDNDLRLLAAVEKAAARVPDLKLHINGLADLEDLLGRIASGVNAPAVAQAFTQLDLGDLYSDLSGLVAKIVDVDKKIPDKVKGLFNTLSFLRAHPDMAHVDWSISTPAKPAIKTDRYTLDLGASAGVSFDAAAKWPDDNASPPLLRMGAHGELKASATATIPYTFGPIKAGAGVSAKPALDFYFNPAGDPLLATAVATRLGALPDPFDFGSVWAAFQDQDLELEGVAYTFDGGAHAELQVAMTNPLPLAEGITASLGAKVGVSASLNSTYRLRLRRSAGGFTAALSRDKVLEEGFTEELKLEVDLSTVTKPALDAVTKLADEWDATLKTIKPFLSPGTYLRNDVIAKLTDHLAVLVHDDTLRQAILADTKGALGAGAGGDPQIVDWLKDKVTGAIDQGRVLADGDIGKAVDQVMAKLATALPTLAANDVSGQLKALITQQIARVNQALVEAVGELFKVPAATLKAALAKAGQTVSGAVASADALLKPVRDLLAKFDELFHGVLDKVEAAAKQKAGARLSFEETFHDETIVELKGEFTGDTDASRYVFAALTLGKLKALVQLVDGPPQAGFALVEADSSITRFSEFKGKEGLEVAFLGFTLSYDAFVAAKAKVKLDGSGDIHVDTEGELQKTLSLFSDRGVSFTDTHALVLTKAMRADGAFGKPSLKVGIGATYSDKSLDPGDVHHFMRGLVSAGLIRAQAETQAETVLEAWRTASGGLVKADIAADLKLDIAQAERLMMLDQRNANGLIPAARQAIVSTALQTQLAFNAFKKKDFEAGASYALSRCNLCQNNKPVGAAEIVLRYRDCIAPVELQNLAQAGEAQEVFEYFIDRATALLQLVDLIDRMGAVYTAVPGVGAAGWDSAKYAQAQKMMALDSKAQLTVASDVVGLFTADITPRTLAFMRTVAELAGADADGKPAGVRVTLTNRPSDAAVMAQTFA